MLSFEEDITQSHPRTADTIVSWLEKKTGPPALAVASVEEATAFVAGKQLTVWSICTTRHLVFPV